jgi:NitT/TauT family transport system ATP-binding protein
MKEAAEKVRLERVSKDFFVQTDGENQVVHALRDISFSVHEGEIIALTGLSGCGKTTILRIVMGLETATEGSVEVDGRRVTRPGYDRGMVFQHAELLPWRTALGNVEFGLEVKNIPAKERRETAARYLKLMGLDDSMSRRPDQLSGGMQQRVGMARALAIDPEVLLMDEPFGALDAQTRETLQAELLNIHEKTHKTIIFVTHDLDEAVLLADRVVMMASHPGRVHEIVGINIPRPREDPIAIRVSEEFTQKRYYIWKTLQTANTPEETEAHLRTEVL